MELVDVDVMLEISKVDEEDVMAASVVEFSEDRSCGLLIGMLSCFCFAYLKSFKRFTKNLEGLGSLVTRLSLNLLFDFVAKFVVKLLLGLFLTLKDF